MTATEKAFTLLGTEWPVTTGIGANAPVVQQVMKYVATNINFETNENKKIVSILFGSRSGLGIDDDRVLNCLRELKDVGFDRIGGDHKRPNKRKKA